MQWGWPVLLAAAAPLALLVQAPAGADGAALAPPAIPPVCSDSGVTIDGGFDQAGYAACEIGKDGQVALTIRPEAEPINPSPWYAVRLVQPEAQSRTVQLRYGPASHRYEPWLSVNGGPWQRLPAASPDPDQSIVAIDLPVFKGTAVLAAQPLQPLTEVLRPWQGHLAAGRVSLVLESKSRDGRPVPLYRHGPAKAGRVYLFTARQHPPETTGAVAFDAFAETVLAAEPARRCPGQAFWFAPVLNPDGIVRGHWRNSAGGVDLNRDWGRFEQPETAGIGALAVRAGQRGSLVLVLDFHSTRRDALYTSQAMGPWASGFSAAIGSGTSLVPRPTRSREANTLKSWAEDLGAATFTIELADGQSPESAAALGRRLGTIFLAQLDCPKPGETP